MHGLTLKSTGSKTWGITYSVIQFNSLFIAESKEHYVQGIYLKILPLKNIAIYIGDAIDKKQTTVYHIRIQCTITRVAATLGFRVEETRNKWMTEILEVHSKQFVDRNEPKYRNSDSSDAYYYTVQQRPRKHSAVQLKRRPVSMFESIITPHNLFI